MNIYFLFQVVGISLSGALAPGPMTASAISWGVRSRWAGIWFALGHAMMEFPLILLLVVGMDQILKMESVKIAIGLTGGVFMIWMARGMLRPPRSGLNISNGKKEKGPFLCGILLSAGNPYFLIWWATIGLAIATQAAEYGVLAFICFALLHWSCDLVWLGALSWASFKGGQILGEESLQKILKICAVILMIFAVRFILDASLAWLGIFLNPTYTP